ncbi:hypothetical protein KAR91_30745 [Candidatus Pacearchaeota archaeon]|nr:hypothetical protein [Candidatus Pacearchaeota archaeon]
MALSNDIAALVPTLLARGLMVLRSRVLMTQLVNLDYSEDAKGKGDTIDVPVSGAKTATDVTPSANQTEPSNTTITKVQVPLDQHKSADFGLVDSDLLKIAANQNFIPLEMDECFQALATAINATVFQQYKGVYGYVGTAGTTPFGSTTADAVNARKVLNQQRAPLMNRRGVLDFDAEATALALAEFSDAEKVGSGDVKLTGEIGRKFGIDWYADDDVPTHTAGTLGGTGVDTVAKASTAQAVGLKAVVSTVGATNAMALLEGDIITFAGDSQTYVLTADAAGAATTDVTLNIEPGLKVALVGSEVISLKATHVSNLVFHRDAFALALRSLGGEVNLTQSANMFTLADPATGLVMRLELIRQSKQWKWELDALWGAKLVRPELACRIAG